VSAVRSLTMDSWSEKQLKFMSLGGNQKLKKYFEDFDLMDEPVQNRYKTQASVYYRQYVSEAPRVGCAADIILTITMT